MPGFSQWPQGRSFWRKITPFAVPLFADKLPVTANAAAPEHDEKSMLTVAVPVANGPIFPAITGNAD